MRKLHQEGILIKVRKGVYKYDPNVINNRQLLNFPPEVKEEIFRRDGYRCVVCGRGRSEGLEIHADHIVPLERGGDNSPENGQTLCSEHNIYKKIYSQTEFGKRLFIRLYKKALANRDQRMVSFCKVIFRVYEEHQIDSHIAAPSD
ncbi:MAG TPA: HNH endonuclease signature motif containing protein [Dehalococcoidia bacterium]|nr:HNH endonuclease signature motif containing protein [Dehalococcoidia bacterium]